MAQKKSAAKQKASVGSSIYLGGTKVNIPAETTKTSTTPTRATPGQFRKAEEASNLTGPIQYVPNILNETPLDDRGDFIENPVTFDQDAFGRLMAQLNQWDLGTLSGVITQLLSQGLSYDSVLTKIKYDSSVNPATGKPYNADYNIRFSGNVQRIAKGLNVIDEREYLANETSYAQTLKQYGLSNLLSTDRTKNQAKFAQYIANDTAPDEFKDRIDLAVTRITNMDPAIMANFKQFYPQVNNTDLISYFLAPEETLDVLKTKVTASEIGAAANQQGLSVGVDRATEFAKMGQTYAGAQRDYSTIAEVLPTGQKLGNIYGEEGITYTQATAEDEYIKQDANAKLKRNRLASKERASFEGSAGNALGAGSLSTQYLRKSSSAGQF